MSVSNLETPESRRHPFIPFSRVDMTERRADHPWSPGERCQTHWTLTLLTCTCNGRVRRWSRVPGGYAPILPAPEGVMLIDSRTNQRATVFTPPNRLVRIDTTKWKGRAA